MCAKLLPLVFCLTASGQNHQTRSEIQELQSTGNEIELEKRLRKRMSILVYEKCQCD